jgi:hypothetical protein
MELTCRPALQCYPRRGATCRTKPALNLAGDSTVRCSDRLATALLVLQDSLYL